MIALGYRLTFLTPAFLGNAEQAGQWRTPPIKALLRQWWRVAYAADHPQGADVEAMRHAEGLLFGHAWLDSDHDRRGGRVAARRSEIRLRLTSWDHGTLRSWDRLEQAPVHHPEVERTNHKVGAHAYLGFGPLDGRGGTKLSEKVNAAIKDGETASLMLALPTEEAARLKQALSLMHLYGTLGGRGRNGWGSFSLSPLDVQSSVPLSLSPSMTLPWRDAIVSDWPQAIGTDAGGPLVWQTELLPDWQRVMRRLAEVKIKLRTQFVFTQGKDATRPEPRHWLSYPVTNHSVREWGGNARLPNSLRFKVRPCPDGKGLRGVIFHMPCLPPAAFRPDRNAIVQVWQQVHKHLDAEPSLKRTAA